MSSTAAQNVRQRGARLGAGDQQQVAAGPGAAGEHDVVGPLDPADRAVGDVDLRAVGLEVEELLGVDPRDGRGVDRVLDRGERRAGRAGRVVPAGESWRRVPASGARGVASQITGSTRRDYRRAHRGARVLAAARPVRSQRSRRWKQPQHPARSPPPRTPRPHAAAAGLARYRRRRAAARQAAQRPLRGASARTGSPRARAPPTSRVQLRDRTGTIPARIFRDADRSARASTAATRSRCAARSSASAASCRPRSRRCAGSSPAPTTAASSCPSPTARSRSSRASSSTSAARSTTATCARRQRGRLDRAGRHRVAARALLARRPPRLHGRPARAHGRGRRRSSASSASSTRASTPTC